jgi:hypothetical protein
MGAILGTSVGAAAYTSANVTRSTSFSISADGSAFIGLSAGTTSGISNNGDKLEIAPSNLNTDGTFTYGDSTDLANSYAFSITNNDSVERSFTISYDTANVTFEIFTQGTDWTDVTSQGTVDSSSDVTYTAAADAADELRVVMTVDTTDVASGATDLDGTLTFTAN